MRKARGRRTTCCTGAHCTGTHCTGTSQFICHIHSLCGSHRGCTVTSRSQVQHFSAYLRFHCISNDSNVKINVLFIEEVIYSLYILKAAVSIYRQNNRLMILKVGLSTNNPTMQCSRVVNELTTPLLIQELAM